MTGDDAGTGLERATAHTTAAAGLWDGYEPPTPDPQRVQRRPITHCGRAGCRCTHTEGCDHGWVEMPAYVDPVTKQTYQPVQPCPMCRPESYQRLQHDSTNDGTRIGRPRT